MDFTGKRAVVTGAASGIGKATALNLAARGARVFVLDMNHGGGEAIAATPDLTGSIEYVYVDLGDRASIETAARDVLNRAEAVDIIINSAGWDRIQPFVENSTEFSDKVVSINLQGPLHLTRLLLPSMIQTGYGKIVNVASDAGRVGSLGETVYAAAKGGMIAFTKSLAREVARYRINVNCVCPGPTDTPLFHAQPDKLKEALIKAIPVRRLAKPEETADAIAFFASAESDYVTAQVLSVSGGLTMVG